jgi:hypothetical protein
MRYNAVILLKLVQNSGVTRNSGAPRQHIKVGPLTLAPVPLSLRCLELGVHVLHSRGPLNLLYPVNPIVTPLVKNQLYFLISQVMWDISSAMWDIL